MLMKVSLFKKIYNYFSFVLIFLFYLNYSFAHENNIIKTFKNLKAFIENEKTIKIYYSQKNLKNLPLNSSEFIINTVNGATKRIVIEGTSKKNNDNLFIKEFIIERLELDKDLPIKVIYIPENIEIPVSVNWKILDDFFYYNDDLGCKINKAKDLASFKLWAPLAEKVELLIYDKYNQNKLIAKFKMSRSQKCVWNFILRSDMLQSTRNNNKQKLDGYFYQYLVKNPGLPAKKVLDPYAKSMALFTVNSEGTKAENTNDFVGKGAIVDPSSVDVYIEPLDLKSYYKGRQDAIIYEVHVRDFTSDPYIGNKLKSRWGTFSAFCERIDYLKSLGVTHIQLLPIMSWYYGDESKMYIRELHWSSSNNQYNWGYDPHSYFSIDGAYSKVPADPIDRIREFKNLVNCLHKNNLGVILDVVYTHMAKAEILEDIVPDYYFFKDENFNYIGDFGNNLATNRKMVKKLILDSVKYWFSEFKIDGMRFDMMGDATQCLIEEAYDVAKSINNNAIFIGEGWRTFKGHLADKSLVGKGADQDWMAYTDCVGVFSDEFRNEIKSGFGCEGEPRFVTNGPRNLYKLFNSIIAKPSNIPTTSPIDVVQYVEAHDNLTLHDVIAIAVKKDPHYLPNKLEIHKRIRLANGILITSQGTIFMHAGQEYGRTKQWQTKGIPEKKYHIGKDKFNRLFKFPYFINDSYDSSDAINKFEWQKVLDNINYHEEIKTKKFTVGLIALRKSTDAFRLSSFEEIDKKVKFIPIKNAKEEDLILCYKSQANNGEVYKVFINADKIKRNFDIPKEEIPKYYEVLVDSENSGNQPINYPVGLEIYGDKITIHPLTLVVLLEKK